MAFLFNLGGEIAMDAMDVEGDVKRNTKTLAIIFGKNIALIISSVLYIGFILISFIPYILGWVGQNYLLIVVVIDIVLLYFVARLLKSKTSSEGRKRVRQLYYTVIFLLIAFIIGVIKI
jgi:geranylgeranylglycerol-phosphate geranylgeranyltransferase